MRLFIVAAVLMATAAARADYIAPDYDLTHAIPAPPGDESARTKQDLVAIHRWQVMRTTAMVARAKRDAEDGLAVFGEPLGERFSLADLPRTVALFSDLQASTTGAIRRAQAAYRRIAPALVDTGLKICEGAPAPSGPGVYPALSPTVLMLDALLLSRMVPERADAIVTRARELSADRVMCGLHYPSDIEAGFMAASALVATLDENAGFRAALDETRAELRNGLGLAETR